MTTNITVQAVMIMSNGSAWLPMVPIRTESVVPGGTNSWLVEVASW
jgi:hypothetical protein